MGTMPNSYSIYGKTGLVILLSGVLAVLKLTDQIEWYWWMVLAPIWLAAALGVVILVLGLILAKVRGDG